MAFAIVCLGHKYQVDQLVAQGIAHPIECYTGDLDEPRDAIAAAFDIAHLTNTRSVLPIAYLHTCSAGARRSGCCSERLGSPGPERVVDARSKLMGYASRRSSRSSRGTGIWVALW
ncbi:hypothetical protein BD309DRAFT_975541 [Dichomitus squalens]|uniref:Uncharacterized protein n=1 Tax=Dichomitus squalens TaxID=114155 RepID=A0A4Q9N8U9_9APHY|nr:hypothetical protein BD309DRAFT_975541 [Dichomitus squalens]TBU51805.1 hypothetical protein BD310DRAFT_313955 [Dichomitus squalens]